MAIPRPSKTWRQRVVLGLIGLVIVMGIAMPLTGRRQLLLDLQSGRIKIQSRIAGVLIESKIRDTQFSKIVSLIGLDPPNESWELMSNKRWFGQHSAPSTWAGRVDAAYSDMASCLDRFGVDPATAREGCAVVIQLALERRIGTVRMTNRGFGLWDSDGILNWEWQAR